MVAEVLGYVLSCFYSDASDCCCRRCRSSRRFCCSSSSCRAAAATSPPSSSSTISGTCGRAGLRGRSFAQCVAQCNAICTLWQQVAQPATALPTSKLTAAPRACGLRIHSSVSASSTSSHSSSSSSARPSWMLASGTPLSRSCSRGRHDCDLGANAGWAAAQPSALVIPQHYISLTAARSASWASARRAWASSSPPPAAAAAGRCGRAAAPL